MEHSAIAALGVIGFGIAIANQLAKRFYVPSILIYLLLGAAAGPSVLGLVEPDELDPFFQLTLEVLVGLVVFEGAFAIDVDYLRRVGRVVRNLLTLGLGLTFVLAGLLAGVLGVLPWSTAFLFGALVSVTGPTVIGPLVRRVRLNDRVRAVLLGEGVLIDPLGAILVVVVLEIVIGGLQPEPLIFIPTRLASGIAFGLLGAALVRGVLWLNRDMDATEVALMLFGGSVAIFALSTLVLEHSQLTAMAVMGVVLAWMRLPHAEAVRAFEDDLGQLIIGAIYVLAAAAVDLTIIGDLWPRGFLVVLLLMVAVRPLVAFLASTGSDLGWRERLYIGAIGPRGVVAAALAAFAGRQLGEEQGGPTLAALVFLTVLLTVAVQSTYAEVVARWLGVKAMRVLVAGAGALSRRVAHQLVADGYDVVLLDNDPETVALAREEGLNAEEGDATDVRLLEKMGARDAVLAVAGTNRDHSNLLFTQYLSTVNPEARLFARVGQPGAAEAFRQAGATVLSEVDTLSAAMAELIGEPTVSSILAAGAGERITAEVRVGPSLAGRAIRELRLPERVLVLLLQRTDGDIVPNGSTVLRRGDRMLLFGQNELVEQARQRLVSIA